MRKNKRVIARERSDRSNLSFSGHIDGNSFWNNRLPRFARTGTFSLLVVFITANFSFLLGAAEPTLIPLCAQPSRGKWNAHAPTLSRDGNVIAYELRPFVEGEESEFPQGICIVNRKKGTQRLLDDRGSWTYAGMPSLNGNGRDLAYAAYSTTTVANIIRYNKRAVKPSKEGPPRVSHVFIYDLRHDIHHLVTRNADGTPQDGEALGPFLSRDSRRVIFSSNASALNAGAKWPLREIFVTERVGNRFELISRSTASLPANRPSGPAKLSRDGRFAIFMSQATNLVDGMSPDSLSYHLYLNDRTLRTIIRIDNEAHGFPAACKPGDFDMDESGRWIVFDAWERNKKDDDSVPSSSDIYLFDRQGTQVTLLSSGVGKGKSRNPSISGDGQKVVFAICVSTSDVLLSDLTVYDRKTASSLRIVSGILDNPEISTDGDTVVFEGDVASFVPGTTDEGMRIFVVNNPL